MESDVLLNKLFTVNSFNSLVFKNRNQTYLKAIEDILGNTGASETNLKNFQSLYHYMARSHRNEYFYKNALLNKILLGRHSVRTSTAIRELPIANNILDFLIINGVGHVYEIKTELDKLDRLQNQIASYFEAFSFCTVVTDETHLEAVREKIDQPQVGIMVLTKRNTLHVDRKAVENTNDLRHETMFKLLRKSEFETILLDEFGRLPEVNQVEYYRTCLLWFQNINILKAQQLVLKQLKLRGYINRDKQQLFDRVPSELKMLVYFSDYTQNDFDHLQAFLSHRIGDVV
ncbi:sce7726 family protein [Levilactobacillus tujiorum]|uniref:Sce7726 family protein n=1 Tax=Levilactobacillus tujiorum TaxID=2912243 RepID=A0ABX1L4K2_9LACO|nr:sce7726 family protein [Levilactobacillus tujiorum]MCH5464075.1 sce7726 family protein [Levilactobacillus tujiorum]NLR11175.1 sce7726 family protein [Lactobacillus sp. HBUAS51387]NLR29198.1 sce7726 family protein [Levilactobacillus tujiorum]